MAAVHKVYAGNVPAAELGWKRWSSAHLYTLPVRRLSRGDKKETSFQVRMWEGFTCKSNI